MLIAARQSAGPMRASVVVLTGIVAMFNDDFYPTPREVVLKLLNSAGDLRGKTILEASAGKGHIFDVVNGLVEGYRSEPIRHRD